MTVATITPLHLADFTFPPDSPLAGEAGVVLAFLVRHPAGSLLFDTGVVEGNEEVDAAYRPVHYSLAAGLDRLGVPLTEVAVVVNSHLHFDHCGHNGLFPRARVLIQGSEYQAALQPDYTSREAFDFPEARISKLQGEYVVWPEIRVVPTPGHTIGHQSLLVLAEPGLVILAGQAARNAAEFDDPAKGGPAGLASAWDPAVALASIRYLRTLGACEVHFSHDSTVWRRDA